MENITLYHPGTASPAPPANKSSAKVYFRNLDGIRCIAALMVILQHLSDYKGDYGMDAVNGERSWVSYFGFYGVTLFFVLSGYLIFYLLFTEREVTGTVKIRDFYMRRVLRIWPLYFGFGLVSILFIDTILGLLGQPANTPVGFNLFFLFTFSINLQMVFWPLNRGVIELYWSVCIEEQFYLFAPWLVKKGKAMLPIIAAIIGIGIGSKFLLGWLNSEQIMHFSPDVNPLAFFTPCWFDAFGCGILAAWLYYNKPVYARIQRVVESYWVQGMVLLITFLYITHILPRPQIVTDRLFSTVPAILFAYIILAASTGKFLVNLEYKALKVGGRWSYGIYVLHASVAQIVLVLFRKFIPFDSFWGYEVLFPVTVIALVIALSGLSYEFFEKRFLRIKKSFTVVQNQKYN